MDKKEKERREITPWQQRQLLMTKLESSRRDRLHEDCELTIVSNGLDLRHQGGIDERAKVEGAHVVDQAKVEDTEVERGKVKCVENTELTELNNGVQLLELEDGINIEDLCLEQTLEGQSIQVVIDGERLENGEVDIVDGAQVANI